MADRHAGFAAALGISEHALEHLAKALYFAGAIDHWLTGETPGIFSTSSVRLALFLDAPKFEFLQANQGRVGLKLHGRGPVTVTPNDPQQPAERRECNVNLLVRLVPRAVLVRGRLAITFDPTTATLDELSIRPFPQSSFSAAAQTHLDSPQLRGLIELAVRVELARRGALLPPFDVGFLGPVATDPSTRPTLAVVDGAIMLGLDVNSSGVTTAGDKALLTNFLGDRDLAMWTNPVALQLAYGTSIKTQLEGMIAAEGGVLQAFSLTVEEGGIRVAGTAGQDAGSVTFSVLAAPVLDKGDDPAYDQLRFVVRDVQVNVQPAWWVVFLEILFAWIVPGIVEVIATTIRSNIVNGIKLSPRNGVASLIIRFTLPDVPEPELTLRIVAFECHTEGVFAGLTLSADFRKAKLRGPAVVDAEDVPTLGSTPLVYRADPGFDALLDDPNLRVRWTARVLRSGTPLLSRDVRVDVAGPFLAISEANVPLLSSGWFRIECRLYRALGSDVEELLDDAITLAVRDRLDRNLPYVRWKHQVLVPVIREEADGSRTILGEKVKTRHSKIHRTAVPGRCRMASKYSQSWINFGVGGAGPTLEYMPALPFARASLIPNRSQVCDYCFFGGPTNQIPIDEPAIIVDP